MEDFHYAGGLRGLLAGSSTCCTRGGHRRRAARSARTLEGALVHNDAVIATREKPLGTEGGLAVLRGNLAPDGAVIKHSAMEPRLRRHAGKAIVFRDYNDLDRRIDDPALGATPDSVLVLQNAGPLGGAGHAGVGHAADPEARCSQQGVRDMVRISDARMSGTSYGACVLHVAPESFVGGPLAFVRDGDVIELDVDARSLDAAGARRGARPPPGAVDAAAVPAPARLRRALRAARDAGEPGLRLRLPAGHGSGPGARDPLKQPPRARPAHGERV